MTGLQRRYFAAVEIDGCAVHPGGARGHQESDHIGDIFNLTETGDAKALAHFLAGFLLRPAGAAHLGLDAPPQPAVLVVPRRSLSSGQAARGGRTWAKNFSA